MTFDEIFDRLIGHEGGYVNHPSDPGGETNWGISKRAYPQLNIATLTRDDAKEIYRRDYWQRGRMGEFDAAIAYQVFDIAVNSGIGTAIRLLQRAVGTAPDGNLGEITLAKINAMSRTDVISRLIAERLDFWTALSTWPAFGKGWARRAANTLRDAASDT